MLLVGFFIVGLTVGADVPASWTLITETAPNEQRGRFAGLAQVLWYVGAIAPLLLGIALLDLDMLATRIIFAHLLVVALITWALRQGMTESSLWEKAQKDEPRQPAQAIKALLEPAPRRRARVPDRHVRRLEPRRRDLRDLLPLHPRRGRLDQRPRQPRAAGDLVRVDRAGGRASSTCR